MKITKKILYIVGIIFSLLLIGLGIFISINKNEKIFVDIYTSLIHIYRVDNNINFGVHIILLAANVILISCNLALSNKNKALPIIIIVLSVLHTNIFSAIASIIDLILISKEQKKREELLEIKRQTLLAEAIENNDDEAIKKYQNKLEEKKPVVKLDIKTSDIILSIIGIIMALIIIVAYALILYINREEITQKLMPNIDDLGLAAILLIIPLIIYGLIILILLFIPILFIIANIANTILMLTTKRFFFARIMSVYGFISLTIFNGIAAIKLLANNNKKLEEIEKIED